MYYKAQIKRSWVESYQDKNGKTKYRLRLVYYDELSHKDRKKSKLIARDTPQARRKAENELIQKIQAEYDRFQTVSVSLNKLQQLYFDYIDSGKSGLRYQTGYQYESNINQFMENIDGNILADEVKITVLHRYFDEMFAAGKSWSYINLRRASIMNMFQFGMDYGYCQSNPLLGYKLKRSPKAKLKETSDKYFTPEELRKLFLYYKDKKRYDILDILKFIYFTGVRFSEAASIRTEDIIKRNGKYYCQIIGTQILKHNNGNAPKLMKNETYKRTGKTRYADYSNIEKQDGTKTNNGMRYLELEPQAVEIYQRHKHDGEYLFIRQSTPAPGLDKRYFGRPFSYSAINKSLKFACQKEGIVKKTNSISSHFLRHTYICRMASYDVPFDYNFIRQIGHKDANITHEIYDHINTINHASLAEGYKQLDKDILLNKL